MITIKEPKIQLINDRARCTCPIDVDGINKEVWFEVDKEYGKYIVTERADAYVIGLLYWAMKNGHDITCECPVTEELLYNLSTILVPTLYKNAHNFHKTKIVAKNASEISGGAVGTGCSCGVDSFDAIYMHYNTEFLSHNLTHLCINNVGAFANCYHEYGQDKVKDERYKKAQELADELGLPLIKTDSNFMESFEQDHIKTHTFSSIFAVYMLKKLWKTYYYGSSGYDYTSFSLKNIEDIDSAQYELLSLQCLSLRELKIYSEGGEKTRFEKVQDIV